MTTQEQVIAWARETGDYLVDKRGREDFIFDSYGIERFAALVAAAEREECAKICETQKLRMNQDECAKKIRARTWEYNQRFWQKEQS